MRVSRQALRRWLRIIGSALVTGLILGGVYQLGRAVTPGSAGEFPMLYSRSVRATEQYRVRSRTWMTQAQEIDRGLVTVLTNPRADVYALSRAAQEELEAALALAQEISLSYPPPALASLRDGVQETADLYLEAAFAVSRWVGEPTEAQYLTALEALRLARATAAVVATNPWLQVRPPVGDSWPGIPSPVPKEAEDGWQE